MCSQGSHAVSRSERQELEHSVPNTCAARGTEMKCVITVYGHNRVRSRICYDAVHPDRTPNPQLSVNTTVAKLMDFLQAESPFECIVCGTTANKIAPVFPACCPDVGIARLYPCCRKPACESQSTTHKFSPFAHKICSPVTFSKLACAVCGTKDCILTCARCKLIIYCGKHCQRLDWSQHKSECTAAYNSK